MVTPRSFSQQKCQPLKSTAASFGPRHHSKWQKTCKTCVLLVNWLNNPGKGTLPVHASVSPQTLCIACWGRQVFSLHVWTKSLLEIMYNSPSSKQAFASVHHPCYFYNGRIKTTQPYWLLQVHPHKFLVTWSEIRVLNLLCKHQIGWVAFCSKKHNM